MISIPPKPRACALLLLAVSFSPFLAQPSHALQMENCHSKFMSHNNDCHEADITAREVPRISKSYKNLFHVGDWDGDASWNDDETTPSKRRSIAALVALPFAMILAIAFHAVLIPIGILMGMPMEIWEFPWEFVFLGEV